MNSNLTANHSSARFAMASTTAITIAAVATEVSTTVQEWRSYSSHCCC